MCNWLNQYPALQAAVNQGQNMFDSRVERAMAGKDTSCAREQLGIVLRGVLVAILGRWRCWYVNACNHETSL
jgi:hypothetical protein